MTIDTKRRKNSSTLFSEQKNYLSNIIIDCLDVGQDNPRVAYALAKKKNFILARTTIRNDKQKYRMQYQLNKELFL